MFVRTERLLLRPGWIEDAPALAQALDDPAVVRNLARVPSPYTIDDAKAFLSLPCAPTLPRFLIFARTQRSLRLIGGIGLHACDDGEIELGYWIGRRHWGLGFATEAGRAVTDLAHHSLRIPRLVAGHMRDNPASGHVLRKLGFRPTGTIAPRHSRARGSEVPCVLFARDESDSVPAPDMRALAA
jgi:RimJ/RimL family protein N-acetyltransferase